MLCGGVNQEVLWLHSMREDKCRNLRLCAWTAKSETDVGEHEMRPTERRKTSSFHNVCSKYAVGGILLLKLLRQKSEESLGPVFSLKIYQLNLLFPIVLCKLISGIKNTNSC